MRLLVNIENFRRVRANVRKHSRTNIGQPMPTRMGREQLKIKGHLFLRRTVIGTRKSSWSYRSQIKYFRKLEKSIMIQRVSRFVPYENQARLHGCLIGWHDPLDRIVALSSDTPTFNG